jgi:hypothetical protein
VKRAARVGCVTFNKRFGTWVYLWWEKRKRCSRTIGTVSEFPTKEAAWQAAKRACIQQPERTAAGTVSSLVEQYREEKMPQRQHATWLQCMARQPHPAKVG